MSMTLALKLLKNVRGLLQTRSWSLKTMKFQLYLSIMQKYISQVKQYKFYFTKAEIALKFGFFAFTVSSNNSDSYVVGITPA